MRILVFILFLTLTAAAQTEPRVNPAFDAKLVEARDSFEKQKYDDAFRYTQEALEIARKSYGADSLQVAAVQNNLGVIYRSKGDYSDAVKSFEDAIRIIEAAPQAPATDLIALRESLGATHRLAGNNTSAEQQYLTAIDVAEKKFGRDSFEMYSPTVYLAKHYAWTGDLSRGDDYYLKAYRIAYLRKGYKATELDDVEDSRTCMVLPQEGSTSTRKDFSERLKELRESLDAGKPDATSTRIVRGGVVNGKATSLPRPVYPANLNFGRKSGAVVVRVLISEEGKVTDARASCGHPDFAKSAVNAALKAKFTPTLLSGQAVKVSGVIVYNFVAR